MQMLLHAAERHMLFFAADKNILEAGLRMGMLLIIAAQISARPACKRKRIRRRTQCQS